MIARVSMFLKSRASLTCFRDYFLPGRVKDLSALGKIEKNEMGEAHSASGEEERRIQGFGEET